MTKVEVLYSKDKLFSIKYILFNGGTGRLKYEITTIKDKMFIFFMVDFKKILFLILNITKDRKQDKNMILKRFWQDH